MVERNLYLVLINVERYAQTGASRLDLIQEGCVSLFRAVDGFDWRRGLLFRTYAVHWLNQAFRNYLYNHTHTVRVPVYLQKALKHINQATIRLGDANATPQEISESSDLSENLVTAAVKAARGSFSIDAELWDSEGSRLRDLLVDESQQGPYDVRIEDLSLEEGLQRALGDLSEREQLVVRMRFGIGHDREHTLAEVAQRLGVSVERVRQIQVRALGKMNTPGLRRELDPYLN
jgi:RNA polymerase primary sigma factor